MTTLPKKTTNAAVGQTYGVIYGTQYTYLNGQRVVDPANGQYIKTSTSDNAIGNSNPDYTAGLKIDLATKIFLSSF